MVSWPSQRPGGVSQASFLPRVSSRFQEADRDDVAESVPYVVVGQPRLTLGTAVALPLLGKSEIVSQSWIWAIPGVTLDMVEYALDDGPALK